MTAQLSYRDYQRVMIDEVMTALDRGGISDINNEMYDENFWAEVIGLLASKQLATPPIMALDQIIATQAAQLSVGIRLGLLLAERRAAT